MKSPIAACAIFVLAASQTLAAETAAPLAPGKPAGVQQAQRHHHRFPLLLTLGVAALVVAGVVVATQNGTNATCTTCGTTGTTG